MNFTELCVWIMIKISGQLLSPYFGKNVQIFKNQKCFPVVKLFLFLHFGLHLYIKDNKNISCVQPCALMANLVAWSLKLADFLVTNNNYQKNKIPKHHCQAAKC